LHYFGLLETNNDMRKDYGAKKPAPSNTIAKAPGAKPWKWQLREQSLIIRLAELYHVLSWASLGGGARYANVIVNHQVEIDNRTAIEQPRQYLRRFTKRLGLNSGTVAAMMTAANVKKTAYVNVRRGDLAIGAWCTAGCSNALRIGDPATTFEAAGTINLVVVINQRLSGSAMVEALAMATEGRVAAVQEGGIMSTRTNQPATGTGTDCIIVASSPRGHSHQYCGKHTLLGELIGKATLRSCAKALRFMSGRDSSSLTRRVNLSYCPREV
jgi:adenosylcobinamide amidohydrolase